MYLNEIDLLEIRLNELNEVVDRFIITEGNKTFSNQEKGFTLENHKDKLQKFWDKIIYLKAPLSDVSGNNPWRKEAFQRNYFTTLDLGIDGEDIVIVSDLDEIPSKKQLLEAIKTLEKQSAVSLYLDFCFYYFNNKCVDKPYWLGPVVTKRKEFFGSQRLRENRNGYFKLKGEQIGWHLTYCSKFEKELSKVRSFSHFREYTNLTQEDIEQSVLAGKCFFDKDRFFQKNNKDLPKYVLQNKKKYKKSLMHKEKKILFFNTISL